MRAARADTAVGANTACCFVASPDPRDAGRNRSREVRRVRADTAVLNPRSSTDVRGVNSGGSPTKH